MSPSPDRIMSRASLAQAIAAGACTGNLWALETTIDTAAIERFITAQMRLSRIPGVALSVVHRDSVVYERGFGVADPEARRVTTLLHRDPLPAGAIRAQVRAASGQGGGQ